MRIRDSILDGIKFGWRFLVELFLKLATEHDSYLHDAANFGFDTLDALTDGIGF